MADIGALLKKLRSSKNLTQQELADITRISQPVINRLENNGRAHDIGSIQSICDALGISLVDFFAESELGIPSDIWKLVSKKENYGLLKTVQAMIAKGYPPDIIKEGVGFLDNALDALKKKYDVPESKGKTTWVDEGLLPEESRGKFTEEEKKAAIEKEIDPPWEKK